MFNMNKRIRYVKAGEGMFKSMQYIKSQDGSEYYVELHGNDGLVNKVGTQESHALAAASSHKIKIAVKKKLTELGCVFDKETRKPKDKGNEVE
jgi:cupin superfamily acireductone dioxygenase involved in methionine salvage